MSCCLKAGFSVYGSNDFAFKNRAKGSFRVCSSVQTLHFKESSNPRECLGKTLDLLDQKPVANFIIKSPKLDPLNAQISNCTDKTLRWWEQSLHPNMIEIQSAQELVDSLLNAGERLVVLDFYSPGCGGCRTLHPKICQLAEMDPNALFLQINYENHKEMCYALNIHVLPFFRFYKGAEGKACSFSCTNATVKKFKDALGKHGTSSRRLGSAKGMDESELSALASRGLISRDLVQNSSKDDAVEETGVFSQDNNLVRSQ
ncbi:atypical CYS HIS rich thioredoxin 5 [Perilla frutescens var. hirtella]|uniref:Atypical CYS HIS rich thioredoxin 5 n=1 Tax=Perilla frutescens var. hirtella TaxID=608512 RepID=A0AAD4P8X8_PERFH|nr:atypical CYS HIS rich thioredoxin 5 [Perilla frutescens var. hirtella]